MPHARLTLHFARGAASPVVVRLPMPHLGSRWRLRLVSWCLAVVGRCALKLGFTFWMEVSL